MTKATGKSVYNKYLVLNFLQHDTLTCAAAPMHVPHGTGVSASPNSNIMRAARYRHLCIYKICACISMYICIPYYLKIYIHILYNVCFAHSDIQSCHLFCLICHPLCSSLHFLYSTTVQPGISSMSTRRQLWSGALI